LSCNEDSFQCSLSLGPPGIERCTIYMFSLVLTLTSPKREVLSDSRTT